MKSGNPSPNPAEENPTEILQKFVGVFLSKGWLNRTLRIRHQDRRYHVSCSELEFSAYRINDCCEIPPGFPGWPVCIITRDHILDDQAMSAFASEEPSIQEWLRCFQNSDFELI